MRRYICKSCTFEWDGPVDEISCPFCNSNEIGARMSMVKQRCSACAYVWSEIDGSDACPACGSRAAADYVKPRKVKCSACSHGWILHEDYPECPVCRSYDIVFDYNFDVRYDIILDAPGDRRTQVILTVADLCTVNMQTAEAMVDQCPVRVIDDLDEMTALPLIIRFEDMGASVTLKIREKECPPTAD